MTEIEQTHTVPTYEAAAEAAQRMEEAAERMDAQAERFAQAAEAAAALAEEGIAVEAFSDEGEILSALDEANSIQGEIFSEMALIQAQMSAMNDLIPGMQDAIAELDSQMSQVSAVLSSLRQMMQNPTGNATQISVALASLRDIKASIGNAVDAAHEEASRTNAEVKADGYNSRYNLQMEALAAYHDEQRRYMNELFVSSQAMKEIGEQVGGYIEGYEELSEAEQANFAIDMSVVAIEDPGFAGSLAFNREYATPEQAEAAEEIVEQRRRTIDELRETPGLSPALEAFLSRSRQMGGGYYSVEVATYIEELMAENPELDVAALNRAFEADEARVSALMREEEAFAEGRFAAVRNAILMRHPERAEFIEELAPDRFSEESIRVYERLVSRYGSFENVPEAERDAFVEGMVNHRYMATRMVDHIAETLVNDLGLSKDLLEELRRNPDRSLEILGQNEEAFARLQEYVGMNFEERLAMMEEAGMINDATRNTVEGFLADMERSSYGLSPQERASFQMEVTAGFLALNDEMKSISDPQQRAALGLERMIATNERLNAKYRTNLPVTAEGMMTAVETSYLQALRYEGSDILTAQTRSRAMTTLAATGMREEVLNRTNGYLSPAMIGLLADSVLNDPVYRNLPASDQGEVVAELRGQVNALLESEAYQAIGMRIESNTVNAVASAAAEDPVLRMAIEAAAGQGFSAAQESNPQLTREEYEQNTLRAALATTAYNTLPDQRRYEEARDALISSFSSGVPPEPEVLNTYLQGTVRAEMDFQSAMISAQQHFSGMDPSGREDFVGLNADAKVSYLTARGIIPATDSLGRERVRALFSEASAAEMGALVDVWAEDGVDAGRMVQDILAGSDVARQQVDDVLRMQAVSVAYRNMPSGLGGISPLSMPVQGGGDEFLMSPQEDFQRDLDHEYHTTRFDYYYNQEIERLRAAHPETDEHEIARLAEENTMNDAYLADTAEYVHSIVDYDEERARDAFEADPIRYANAVPDTPDYETYSLAHQDMYEEAYEEEVRKGKSPEDAARAAAQLAAQRVVEAVRAAEQELVVQAEEERRREEEEMLAQATVVGAQAIGVGVTGPGIVQADASAGSPSPAVAANSNDPAAATAPAAPAAETTAMSGGEDVAEAAPPAATPAAPPGNPVTVGVS